MLFCAYGKATDSPVIDQALMVLGSMANAQLADKGIFTRNDLLELRKIYMYMLYDIRLLLPPHPLLPSTHLYVNFPTGLDKLRTSHTLPEFPGTPS